VSRRARILAFGSAAALTMAGIAAAVAGGLVGQVLAIAFITLGLGGALLLIFLEVGLSEDQARAREQERQRRRRRPIAPSDLRRSRNRRRL
jgi:threonine/homoserine/homoserine lactone efflux protein